MVGPADGADPAVRVVLADRHPVVRDGLRALLTEAGIRVAAEAGCPREALREVLLHRPEVLILDPVPGEMAPLREAVRAAPETSVLVFSFLDDDSAVAAAVHAGARGYLLKSATRADIVRAVRAVAAGDGIFTSRIAGRFAGLLATPQALAGQAFPQLTPRERQVLDLIAAGLPNAAIAAALRLAPKTIGNHISAIFTKLGVPDRPAAIVQARDAGLGRPDNVEHATRNAGHGSTVTS